MNKHSVKFVRGSKTIWDQLNTTPEKIDNNTLYFIYEDENYSVGKLYLGQRLITDDKIINIKDIGDIQIEDESLIDKQILIYNEENQEWKNSSLEEIIDLSNYYTKSEVDNSLLETVSRISTLSFQIVQEKPPIENTKTNIIYLTPKEKSNDKNIYDEWIYINNNWELIGTTEINLDNYYDSNYIDNKINDITFQLENILSSQIKNATINNEGVSRIVLIYHGKQWSPRADTSTSPGDFTKGDFVININPNNYGFWLCTSYEEYYQGSTKRYRYTLLPIKIPLSFFQNDSNFLIEHQDISSKEDIINKVVSISSSSTDDQYPSAKCVYNILQEVYTKSEIENQFIKKQDQLLIKLQANFTENGINYISSDNITFKNVFDYFNNNNFNIQFYICNDTPQSVTKLDFQHSQINHSNYNAPYEIELSDTFWDGLKINHKLYIARGKENDIISFIVQENSI